jgi:SAM-dependent methyltransferase
MNAILLVKTALERTFPPVYKFVRRRLPRWVLFSLIYHANYWGNADSRSGPGSDLNATEVTRAELPALLQKLGVRSLLDAACGDFFWMSQTGLPIDTYIGVDIVPSIVKKNVRMYGNERTQFYCLDICRDELPQVDAILAREVLIHLSNNDILEALANFRRTGAKYLLATTFAAIESNDNIATSQWRATNLQRPPFNLPAPITLIDEERPGDTTGECLGVWRLDDLGDSRAGAATLPGPHRGA